MLCGAADGFEVNSSSQIVDKKDNPIYFGTRTRIPTYCASCLPRVVLLLYSSNSTAAVTERCRRECRGWSVFVCSLQMGRSIVPEARASFTLGFIWAALLEVN